ncbi:MAG: class I SAM-dependent methyltransferase [Acidimicrobiia bacterium]|nr:class I SAM-dependent methyltransferase [Acidimicrobiia bacterium]
MTFDEDILFHYEDRYDEDTRLSESGLGQLELIRTQIILQRHLQPPPATVLDVGGGPGVYAYWLDAAGYEVDLIDVVPRHVRQATERGIRATLADARQLPVPDDTRDAVLLLGPLYHLQEREDRLTAIRESIRVARPGAPVFAAAISRYAPAIDALDSGFFDDPAFAGLLGKVTATGHHHNPTGDPDYFTTAYFHLPGDLEEELLEAGLVDVEILAVEGIGWVASDLDERMADEESQTKLLGLLEMLEREASILGASPHLLGVGWVPQ